MGRFFLYANTPFDSNLAPIKGNPCPISYFRVTYGKKLSFFLNYYTVAIYYGKIKKIESIVNVLNAV